MSELQGAFKAVDRVDVVPAAPIQSVAWFVRGGRRPGTPEAPLQPPPRREPQQPTVALDRVEKLANEIPGILRTVGILCDDAVRLDMLDLQEFRGMESTRNAYPRHLAQEVSDEVEHRRAALMRAKDEPEKVWLRVYEPHVEEPRRIHERALQLEEQSKKVKELDEVYARLEEHKESWSGADASAYRSRVTPQRKAADEHRQLLTLVQERLDAAATAHAGVYLVVHQMVLRAFNSIRASNQRKPAQGDLGRRMGDALGALVQLSEWMETYATKGEWRNNLDQLRQDLEKVPDGVSNFPDRRWPRAIIDVSLQPGPRRPSTDGPGYPPPRRPDVPPPSQYDPQPYPTPRPPRPEVPPPSQYDPQPYPRRPIDAPTPQVPVDGPAHPVVPTPQVPGPPPELQVPVPSTPDLEFRGEHAIRMPVQPPVPPQDA